MNKYLRISGLSSHVLLTLLLVVASGQTAVIVLFANPGASSSVAIPISVFSRQMLPVIVTALVSLIGSFPLSLRDTSRMVMERRLLPLLFLSYTLCGIKVIPLHSLATSSTLVGASTIAVIHQAALLFSTFIVLTIGLFQQGINMFKIGHLIFIGALACLLLALISPVSANTLQAVHTGTFSSLPVTLANILMAMIAILCYIAIFLHEKTRHNAIRCGGFILLITGSLLMATFSTGIVQFFGTIAYAAGVFMVSPVLHPDRM